MRNPTVEKKDVGEGIQRLELIVKNLSKYSKGYKPISSRMAGYTVGNDPMDTSDVYYEPFRRENSINALVSDGKKTICSLVKNRTSMTQTQFYTLQRLLVTMSESLIDTQRLEDASQLTEVLASGRVEGATSPMKKRNQKVKELLQKISKGYQSKYDSLNGSSSSRPERSENEDSQYSLQKNYKSFLAKVEAGNFGQDLKDIKEIGLYSKLSGLNTQSYYDDPFDTI